MCVDTHTSCNPIGRSPGSLEERIVHVLRTSATGTNFVTKDNAAPLRLMLGFVTGAKMAVLTRNNIRRLVECSSSYIDTHLLHEKAHMLLV